MTTMTIVQFVIRMVILLVFGYFLNGWIEGTQYVGMREVVFAVVIAAASTYMSVKRLEKYRDS